MSETNEGLGAPRGDAGTSGEGTETGSRDEGLREEQESAEAMDSDVPQPPDASSTTEGQPS